MKIGIITIHNSSNYGASLQAFALLTYIKRVGHEVRVINYDNPHMSKGLAKIRHGFNLMETYYMMLDILNLRSRIRMIRLFEKFSEEHLDLTRKYSKRQLLENFSEEFDIYVSGSDQIWNPNVTDGIVDAVYFCGMAQHGKKVISYASSFGGYDFKDERKNKEIKAYIKKYSAISVRESSYIEKAEELAEKHITKVLDPVFLLSGKEWEKILGLKRIARKPYILIYAMAKHKEIIRKVLECNKDKRYEILMVGIPLSVARGVKYINDIGPKEFLELFKNASVVVTNSFHGTSFGIIFNKRLQVLDNARNMNRIYDLLEKLSLMDILIREGQKINVNVEIDYEIVNNQLQKIIRDSKNYLAGELV